MLSLSGAMVGDVRGSLEALGATPIHEPPIPQGLVPVESPGSYNVSCGSPGLVVYGVAIEEDLHVYFECGGILLIEDSIIQGIVTVESLSREPVYIMVRNSTLGGLNIGGNGIAGAWIRGAKLGAFSYTGPPSIVVEGIPYLTVVELNDTVVGCGGNVSMIIPGYTMINGLEACGANILVTTVSMVAEDVRAVNGSRIDVLFSAFAFLRDVSLQGSIRLQAPNNTEAAPYRWLLIRDSRVTRGGGFNVTAAPNKVMVRVPACPVVAENVTLQANSIELQSPWILARESLISTASLTIKASSLFGLIGSRLSLTTADITPARNANIVLDLVEARLASPLRIVPQKGLNLTINQSSLSCPSSCIAIPAPSGARVEVGVWDTVFQGKGAAISIYSSLPPGALAHIVTGESYYSGPAGPTVIVGDQVLRRGGMSLVLAGWTRGSVEVKSWLATPRGPPLAPSNPPEGVNVTPLEPATLYYASTPESPAAIIVFDNPSSIHILRLEGAKVKYAITEAGATILGLAEDNTYVATAAEPFKQLLLVITRAQEEVVKTTTAPSSQAEAQGQAATSMPASPTEGAAPLHPSLLIIIIILMIVALIVYRRAPGRGRG